MQNDERYFVLITLVSNEVRTPQQVFAIGCHRLDFVVLLHVEAQHE